MVAAQVESVAIDGATSVDDGMKFSGLSRSELYRAMRDGKIKFTKIGKRRLILRKSLVEFLERGIPRVEAEELAKA